MNEFYVEKAVNESGEHMVHTALCSSLPAKEEMYYIGVRSNSEAPLKEAANWFAKSTPCPNCISR